MPLGEHAVHGTADLSGGANGDRPTRARQWRPSSRVLQAAQRAAISVALVAFGFGLASTLQPEVARRCSQPAAGGARKAILSEDPYEELPGIGPHNAEYWRLTYPRQVEELINATLSGVRDTNPGC